MFSKNNVSNNFCLMSCEVKKPRYVPNLLVKCSIMQKRFGVTLKYTV
jgi:hypothetical protein